MVTLATLYRQRHELEVAVRETLQNSSDQHLQEMIKTCRDHPEWIIGNAGWAKKVNALATATLKFELLRRLENAAMEDDA